MVLKSVLSQFIVLSCLIYLIVITTSTIASIAKALQTDQDEDGNAMEDQRKAKLSEEHDSIVASYKELIRDQVLSQRLLFTSWSTQRCLG